ncbi:hypothetical protein [Hufsiella ginkgonis]|uniref:Uncharacterized protein n=1 Tax=Hufsiella ginkgonis TaxID=2695274 RepID=A0A7K1Y1X7_9SPHI|nr:hypothetical protein [Hufsiella ginkgonis]MXV17192.1 hypothetical protein [Hufsiella ginkgonis]
MKKLLFFFCFTVCSLRVSGQLRNDSLEYRIRPDYYRTGSLYLSVNNFNFLRNYEFYNKFQDGYTLYGTQLSPQLAYYANPELVLTAGALLQKDFGSEGISKTYPLFSVKYQKGNTALIAGALEANVNHRLIEPLYDFEKTVNDPVEYGTQLVISKPALFLDAFINWKRMIYKPSPVQEQIVAGLSSDVRLAAGKRITFSVPLQLTAFHQGGQIDTMARPLQTIVNSAAGVKLTLKSNGFVGSWRTENYFVTYNELSPVKIRPFSRGTGAYLNLGADTRLGTVLASYWNGQGFIAINGMPIYQSLSQQINHPGYSEKHRELLFLRYAFQKDLTQNFRLDFRVEPVFDLGPGGKAEFYHSLFLVYRQDFRMVRSNQ